MPDLIILLLQLGFLVLVVWSIWQVAQDAELRGKPGWLIAGLALITWPIGVFLWLAARPGVKKKGPVRFPGSIDCPKRGLTIPAHAFRAPTAAYRQWMFPAKKTKVPGPVEVTGNCK